MDERQSRLECVQCGSGLVPSLEIELLLNRLSPDDMRHLAHRLLPRTGTSRQCPRCASQMTPYSIYEVAVDACPEHGVWFDSGELSHVLSSNAEAFADRAHTYRPPDVPSTWQTGRLFEELGQIFAALIRKRKLKKHQDKTTPES